MAACGCLWPFLIFEVRGVMSLVGTIQCCRFRHVLTERKEEKVPNGK